MKRRRLELKRILAVLMSVLFVGNAMDIPVNAVAVNDTVYAEEADAGITHMVSDTLSFEEALEKASDGDVIDITNGADILTTEGEELVPLIIDKSVTITGGELMVRKAGILLEADVTFQNMSLCLANSCHDAVWANGHTLTIDGVTCTSREVDLFGGSLYVITDVSESTLYTGSSDGPGSAGVIVVKGTNSGFGNIYAGSMNGAFGGSVTIQLEENLNNGIGTMVYCSGALEGLYDPNNFLDPYYQPDAPVAEAVAYPVTGAVSVALTYHSGITVNGSTGGTSNAAVTYTDGGKGYAFQVLLHDIGSLSLNGETTSIPKLLLDKDSVISSDLELNLPANTQLDLTDFADNQEFAIGALNGGGTLVLASEQSLTITGEVSGSTDVAIGGVAYDGVSSAGTVYRDHVYIKAANSVADDNTQSFVLLPPGGEDVDFVRDDNGDWWVPAGDLLKLLRVNTVFENVVLTDAKSSAAEVIAELPSMIEVTVEGDDLADLAIEWSCDDFSAAEAAVNTFTWTVPESETDGWLDCSGVVLTGTITVTNPGAVTEPEPEMHELRVVCVTAESRVYDGTNEVKITGVQIDGIQQGEDVSVVTDDLIGTVESAEPGTYEDVCLPVLTLTGEHAADYQLVQPTEAVPTRVTISKIGSSITVKNAVYEKIYGDEPFSIAEDISVVGDGALVYGLSGGLDAKGNPKAVSEILKVSADGLVTILGSGSLTVTLDMAETQYYSAAAQQSMVIQVRAWDDVSRKGFFIEPLDTMIYTGKAIKPEPVVYDGNSEIRLTKGKDYTVSYKNNKKAYTLAEGEEGFDARKAPTMIIQGKGNFAQKLTVYYTIQPKDLSDCQDKSIVAEDIVVEANGKVQKKVPVVQFNGKKLGKTAFTVAYPMEADASAYKEPGTYPVVITGKGDFTESRTVNLIVAAKGTNLAKATINKIPAQEFDGVNPVELDDAALVVTAKQDRVKVVLQKGIHYDVEYVNNTGIGTATVIIKAIDGSGYAGYKKATFKITGMSIAGAEVEGVVNKPYSGRAQELALQVDLSRRDAKTGVMTVVSLKEGTDYVTEYTKNIDVGTATVTIKGIGKYTGTIKKRFKITPIEISEVVDISDGDISVKYVKGGAQPQINIEYNGMQLVEGKDYAVSYKNNKKVYMLTAADADYNVKKAPTMTIKGKGNFRGAVSRTFVIVGRALSDEDVAVTMTVNDKAVSSKKGGYISKVVLTDKDGKVLKQGIDYSAPVYTMVDEAGETVLLTKNDIVPVDSEIAVSVSGLGAYESRESLTATYRITAKDFTKVKVKSIQKEYTGTAVELTAKDFLDKDGKGIVTFGSGSDAVSLEYGKDFEIVEGSYKNNFVKGTASVTLRGMGDYGGTKTVKFKIGARSLFFWWL